MEIWRRKADEREGIIEILQRQQIKALKTETSRCYIDNNNGVDTRKTKKREKGQAIKASWRQPWKGSICSHILWKWFNTQLVEWSRWSWNSTRNTLSSHCFLCSLSLSFSSLRESWRRNSSTVFCRPTGSSEDRRVWRGNSEEEKKGRRWFFSLFLSRKPLCRSVNFTRRHIRC